MKFKTAILCSLAFLTLAGCSTTQEVFLAKTRPVKEVSSVAQVRDDGNSTSVDSYLQSALLAEGLNVKSPLPKGVRKSKDVDALVGYVDVWRWDLAMYLQSISIRMFDADTGDLLVSGKWKDSALHGFRDSEAVVKDLVREMMAKLRAATPEKKLE